DWSSTSKSPPSGREPRTRKECTPRPRTAGPCGPSPPGTGGGGPGPQRPASGCDPGRHQGFQGLVQGEGQRNLAVQSGQPEQPADLRPGAGHVQAAAARGGALGRADQRGEPGQVD